jgi:hypothetical protein
MSYMKSSLFLLSQMLPQIWSNPSGRHIFYQIQNKFYRAYFLSIFFIYNANIKKI